MIVFLDLHLSCRGNSIEISGRDGLEAGQAHRVVRPILLASMRKRRFTFHGHRRFPS
jgi:hypothetical protein